MLLFRPLLAAALGLAGACAGWAAEVAHQHGAAALEVAIDGRSISLALDAPQDSLLGHERAPRSAAEQQAASALLATLQDGTRLWALPPGLRCVQRSAEVDAPLLQGRARPGEHADVAVRWTFDCARVDGLRQLDLGPLMDAFPRLQQLRAQVVAPGGQYQASAKRPQRLLAWGR
jgi:hypothetical protein